MDCIEQIAAWADKYQGDPNRWNRTALGRAIRLVAQRFGNWKNAPRGNPKKALQTALQNQRGEI